MTDKKKRMKTRKCNKERQFSLSDNEIKFISWNSSDFFKSVDMMRDMLRALLRIRKFEIKISRWIDGKNFNDLLGSNLRT